MTPEEAKQAIVGWSSAGDGLEYTGDQTESGADFAFGVRAGGDAGGPVDLQVLHEGGDRITIRHKASLASSAADSATKILDQRPGWVTGSVERGESGTSAQVQTFVYLDGLSKNSFLQATAELARTARLLGGVTVSAAAAAAPAPVQPAQPSYSPQPAPTFTPQPQQQYTPQQSYTPQPQPAQGPWVPTHSVPPQGLRAWSAPDPAGPVVANLAPGLPIQVAEVRGAWARVICSNGWVGWIDGRLIGVAA